LSTYYFDDVVVPVGSRVLAVKNGAEAAAVDLLADNVAVLNDSRELVGLVLEGKGDVLRASQRSLDLPRLELVLGH
jgi:hypothetical protein